MNLRRLACSAAVLLVIGVLQLLSSSHFNTGVIFVAPHPRGEEPSEFKTQPSGTHSNDVTATAVDGATPHLPKSAWDEQIASQALRAPAPAAPQPSSPKTSGAGPQPTWSVISHLRACEDNEQGIKRSSYEEYLPTLEACKDACEGSCRAIDYFAEAGWCSFYDEPCTVPVKADQGASSHRREVPAGYQATEAPQAEGGWFVMSTSRTCEDNDEGVSRTHSSNLHALASCKAACSGSCVAVDFYSDSGLCNFYDEPCRAPGRLAQGGSSHRKDTNGGSGGDAKSPASGPVVRDCTLRSFLDLLNSFNRWGEFRGKAYVGKGVAALFEHLLPWMLAEPRSDPSTPEAIERLRPPASSIDCGAHQYAGTFTGKKLASPHFIVDIVPFAFDLTFLELRLLETGPYVDLFVISEAETNERGDLKPLVFEKAMEQPRFARFRHKILHVIRRATPKMLQNQARWFHETRTRGFPTACLASIVWDDQSAECLMHKLGNNRGFEDQCGFIREEGNIPRRAIGPWGVPEKALAELKKKRSSALVLQNDEDELMKGDVLNQVKHCELRDGDPKLYAPAVHWKLNVHWTQKGAPGDNLGCLHGADADRARDLLPYLWRPSVVIARLERASCRREDSGMYLEADGTNYLRRNMPCSRPNVHLGIGSSIHLSSVAEPLAGWLKDFNVLEGDIYNAFPPGLVEAGKQRQITSRHIIAKTAARLAKVICNPAAGWTHISHLSRAAQEVMRESQPWPLRLLPQRYCFMSPDTTASLAAEPFAITTRPNFPNGCSRHV